MWYSVRPLRRCARARVHDHLDLPPGGPRQGAQARSARGPARHAAPRAQRAGAVRGSMGLLVCNYRLEDRAAAGGESFSS